MLTAMDSKRRKLTMIRMREAGYSFQEIGETFNIKKQRVHQIIGNLKPIRMSLSAIQKEIKGRGQSSAESEQIKTK